MNPLDPNSSFNGPLTPHQYRQNDNSSLIPNANGAKNASVTRFAPLVLAGIALLILPVTIWQINTQQDIRQQASQNLPTEQRAIAKIGSVLITEEDVDLEYTKQQNSKTFVATPTSLKSQILDDLIKKKLILAEAGKRNINVSENEVNERIKLLQSFENNNNVNADIVFDTLLEEKVAAAVSPSTQAAVAYSNNNSAPTLSFFETIRSGAIDEKSLLTAADPFAKQSNDVMLVNNLLIPSNSTLFSDSANLDISNLEEGEISEIIEDNDRFFIIEAVEKNSGEYDSFEEFITTKRNESVELLSN